MRICLDCRTTVSSRDWRCPACGWHPELREGRPCFAPALASGDGGYNRAFHERLVNVEPGNFWYQARNELIVWALRHFFPRGREFLELGCGTGFVLSAIRKHCPEIRVSGGDASHEGLDFARKRVPDAHLYQMDILRIPFSGEFDVIGAFDVMEHIADDLGALRQIHGALAADGGVILTVPQHQWLWSAVDRANRHQRRYGGVELRQKLRQAGFKVEMMTSFNALPLPLQFLNRIRNRDDGRPFDIMSAFDIPPLVNAALSKTLALERWAIKRGMRFRAGGTLLAVARKVWP